MSRNGVTAAERRSGIARENSLQWALQTATPGEDAMATLARAELFQEYILGSVTALSDVERYPTGIPLNRVK